MTSIELSVPVNVEQISALDVLADATGLPKTRIKDAMTKGAVWLTRGTSNRRLRRAKSQVQRGDRLSIYYNDEILARVPPEPVIISDHSTFSVWHKPAGLLSSGSRFGDHCAINRVVERHGDRPVFLVHRLDQYTTGLMVLAHAKQVAAGLSAQFRARTVKKHYKAVIEGTLTETLTIDTPLDGKEAISHVTPLASSGTCTLVSVSMSTGRKHQIRRHLAGIRHPVVGDRLYGQGGPEALQLTAYRLEFSSPDSGERLRYLLPEAFHPTVEPAA